MDWYSQIMHVGAAHWSRLGEPPFVIELHKTSIMKSQLIPNPVQHYHLNPKENLSDRLAVSRGRIYCTETKKKIFNL